jgi:hypothetical protein
MRVKSKNDLILHFEDETYGSFLSSAGHKGHRSPPKLNERKNKKGKMFKMYISKHLAAPSNNHSNDKDTFRVMPDELRMLFPDGEKQQEPTCTRPSWL